VRSAAASPQDEAGAGGLNRTAPQRTAAVAGGGEVLSIRTCAWFP